MGGVTRFRWVELLGPVLIVVVLAYGLALSSASGRFLAQGTLATLVMVLALQIFIGTTGVLSFGHSAFALIGGFTTGLLTMPTKIKGNVMSDLWAPLQEAHTSPFVSIPIAVLLGALVSGLLGIFLMRLSGLAAGIATFAVLMVADNIFFNSRTIGPGPQVMPQVPHFALFDANVVLAVLALVVAYLVGVSRVGRLLKASREDHLAAQALGANIKRLRMTAFAISGGVAALAGSMYAHHAGAVSARDFYLEFTFTTLAMAVIGGTRSVWGAVVGTLAVTTLGQIMLKLESGVHLGTYVVSVPSGVRGMVIAAALVLILLWRPTGLTRGRELALPGRRADRSRQLAQRT